MLSKEIGSPFYIFLILQCTPHATTKKKIRNKRTGHIWQFREGLMHLRKLCLAHSCVLRAQSSVCLQRHGSSIHSSRVAGKAPHLPFPACDTALCWWELEIETNLSWPGCLLGPPPALTCTRHFRPGESRALTLNAEAKVGVLTHMPPRCGLSPT